MPVSLVVEPHPLLELAAFTTELDRPLSELGAFPDVDGAISGAPLSTDDAVKSAVRDLLRAGGYKPSGRSKPASEYLVGARAEGRFPRINAVVDACNIASLCSGLPISLVDLDRVSGDVLTVRVAPAGTSYLFNPSGQVIDASGLLCVYDADGPTGTPVKDAQRTKTHDGTRRALAVLWGTTALPGRAAIAARWYRALTESIPGARTIDQ
ncbi:MAG TPA: phenylalanine--tRNA ligase beta subunit-related protein [Kofleriaceae bacterium]